MTARGETGAVSNDGRVSEAASHVLSRGGTAVDAVIAGYLSAAAVLPGVLLGPLHILVAGPGVGAHGYDGAVLQPGKDAPRPRGFREGDAIPPAAFVAVSASIPAIVAAHAQDGATSLGELAAPAVKLAQAQGAPRRAELLKRIGATGVLAAREAGLTRAVLDVAGRPVGGNVTQTDLEGATAIVGSLVAAGGALRLREVEIAGPAARLQPIVAVACDVRGVLAIMHTAHDPDGVYVEGVQVSAPRIGVPVRRGVPRLSPGQRIPAACPAAILVEAGVPWAALAMESSWDIPVEALSDVHRTDLALDDVLRKLVRAKTPTAQSALAVVRGTGANAGVRSLRVHAAPEG